MAWPSAPVALGGSGGLYWPSLLIAPGVPCCHAAARDARPTLAPPVPVVARDGTDVAAPLLLRPLDGSAVMLGARPDAPGFELGALPADGENDENDSMPDGAAAGSGGEAGDDETPVASLPRGPTGPGPPRLRLPKILLPHRPDPAATALQGNALGALRLPAGACFPGGRMPCCTVSSGCYDVLLMRACAGREATSGLAASALHVTGTRLAHARALRIMVSGGEAREDTGDDGEGEWAAQPNLPSAPNAKAKVEEGDADGAKRGRGRPRTRPEGSHPPPPKPLPAPPPSLVWQLAWADHGPYGPWTPAPVITGTDGVTLLPLPALAARTPAATRLYLAVVRRPTGDGDDPSPPPHVVLRRVGTIRPKTPGTRIAHVAWCPHAAGIAASVDTTGQIYVSTLPLVPHPAALWGAEPAPVIASAVIQALPPPATGGHADSKWWALAWSSHPRRVIVACNVGAAVASLDPPYDRRPLCTPPPEDRFTSLASTPGAGLNDDLVALGWASGGGQVHASRRLMDPPLLRWAAPLPTPGGGGGEPLEWLAFHQWRGPAGDGPIRWVITGGSWQSGDALAVGLMPSQIHGCGRPGCALAALAAGLVLGGLGGASVRAAGAPTRLPAPHHAAPPTVAAALQSPAVIGHMILPPPPGANPGLPWLVGLATATPDGTAGWVSAAVVACYRPHRLNTVVFAPTRRGRQSARFGGGGAAGASDDSLGSDRLASPPSGRVRWVSPDSAGRVSPPHDSVAVTSVNGPAVAATLSAAFARAPPPATAALYHRERGHRGRQAVPGEPLVAPRLAALDPFGRGRPWWQPGPATWGRLEAHPWCWRYIAGMLPGSDVGVGGGGAAEPAAATAVATSARELVAEQLPWPVSAAEVTTEALRRLSQAEAGGAPGTSTDDGAYGVWAPRAWLPAQRARWRTGHGLFRPRDALAGELAPGPEPDPPPPVATLPNDLIGMAELLTADVEDSDGERDGDAPPPRLKMRVAVSAIARALDLMAKAHTQWQLLLHKQQQEQDEAEGRKGTQPGMSHSLRRLSPRLASPSQNPLPPGPPPGPMVSRQRPPPPRVFSSSFGPAARPPFVLPPTDAAAHGALYYTPSVAGGAGPDLYLPELEAALNGVATGSMDPGYEERAALATLATRWDSAPADAVVVPGMSPDVLSPVRSPPPAGLMARSEGRAGESPPWSSEGGGQALSGGSGGRPSKRRHR